MKRSTSDDLSLIKRAMAGDESAIVKLYAHYGDLLFAFVYHSVAELPIDPDEICQDTWLAALQSLARYRGQSRFFTWLCGVARHKITDCCRRCTHDPVKVFLSESGNSLSRLTDKGPLPEDILMQRATRLCVVEALAMLPEDYGIALIARYADGSSVDKVSQILNKSYKATESLLSRARKAFCQALVYLSED